MKTAFMLAAMLAAMFATMYAANSAVTQEQDACAVQGACAQESEVQATKTTLVQRELRERKRQNKTNNLILDTDSTGQQGAADLDQASCPIGSISSTGLEPCTLCAAGKYQGHGGKTRCIECSPGHFSEEGKAKCSQCDGGEYADTSGSSACKDMPRCDAGSYQKVAASRLSPGECAKCPAGQIGSPLSNRLAIIVA